MTHCNYLPFRVVCAAAIATQLLSACQSSKKIMDDPVPVRQVRSVTPKDTSVRIAQHVPAQPTEEDQKSEALKNKYARYLKTTPDNIHNIKLYAFIDEWLNTPYLWGGSTKKGIDCSAFVQRLYADVYNIIVPRTSITQFYTNRVEAFKDKNYLHEGDLVFFRTIKGTEVSHVGFYLSNHRFVNASSSKGVSIGNLEDAYWKTKFVAAGRIKQ
ncbi:MAG: C40 family peptidase [Chitinophagaceae bacterium]